MDKKMRDQYKTGIRLNRCEREKKIEGQRVRGP